MTTQATRRMAAPKLGNTADATTPKPAPDGYGLLAILHLMGDGARDGRAVVFSEGQATALLDCIDVVDRGARACRELRQKASAPTSQPCIFPCDLH